MKLIRRFVADQSGATAIEYGLIAALIAVVLTGVLRAIGTKMNAKFIAISGNLT